MQGLNRQELIFHAIEYHKGALGTKAEGSYTGGGVVGTAVLTWPPGGSVGHPPKLFSERVRSGAGQFSDRMRSGARR